MGRDFLEQLAEIDVPPPPEQFDHQLHERVNRSLACVQLVEMLCGAFPAAIWELGRALVAFARFTLTGKYDTPKRKQNHS